MADYKKPEGPLRLGDKAPDFEAESTHGKIKFHDWLGDSWVSSNRASLAGIKD